MRERTGRRTLLLVAVGLSGVVLAAGSAAISFASVATASGPPVVTETFTVLPCSTQTTVGMEGCAEHTVLELDKRINTLAARIYGHLSKRFRTHFVSAARDWSRFASPSAVVSPTHMRAEPRPQWPSPSASPPRTAPESRT